MTRAQMATFMQRLAGVADGIGPSVVAVSATEANHASTAAAADSAGVASSAADADALGGVPPEGYDTSAAVATLTANVGALSGPTNLGSVDVSAGVASKAVISATVTAQYLADGGTDGFTDVAVWAQVDDATCVAPAPGEPSIGTVAPSATEPLHATIAYLAGAEVSAGGHTVSLCAMDDNGDGFAVERAVVSVVVSPSGNSGMVTLDADGIDAPLYEGPDGR